MKKVITIFGVILLASVILTSCGRNQTEDKGLIGETNKTRDKPNSTKTYSLQEAIKDSFVEISADGNGTFRNIKLVIKNNSDCNLKISVPAGVYFENPDDRAQSLITAKKIDELLLSDNQEFRIDALTFCTNVKQKVPGFLKGWIFKQNYNGGLDEVIEFYGKHEKVINKWLEKKNERFSTEENRLLFFQTVIWFHEGGQYSEILNLLKNDVFNNDIQQAKSWLDDIQKEAVQLSHMIKDRDSEKIQSWLKQKTLELIPTNIQVEKVVDEGQEKLEKLRNRLKRN
jgi:hypothetical protein